MSRLPRPLVIGLAVAALSGLALGYALTRAPDLRRSVANLLPDPDTETIEVTDYSRPKDDETALVDDRLEDKKTTFDPALVDRRPIGGWSLNASDAVIGLDVPIIKADQNPERLVLHPSYSAAIKQARGPVLPSINMIDGKVKQFDDGLYAAIDQAYFQGHGDSMKSQVRTFRRIFDRLGKASPALDYMAAGLSLAGEPVELSAGARRLAADFLSVEFHAKPIGFYTWNKTLSDDFRFRRYFAQPIPSAPIVEEIARVLREDGDLRRDYEAASNFYGKMTNPLVGLTPVAFIDGTPPGPLQSVALFPPSSSREVELFERTFPRGLPPNTNLMRELIAAIRSGKVDLKPGKDSGWYDYQVYALETLLLPEKGVEADKLLLSKSYKKRMLEAFQALITKRRETHSLQAKTAMAPAEAPPEALASVQPRLRVEPNLTYYLRTARSYGFLATFLESTLGEAALKSLHGLREGGEREMELLAELHRMRDLFYGLSLLAAEDIGLRPAFLEGEAVDREAAEKIATDWLAGIADDADLATDTRVSVPIHFDPRTGAVRLWMTIGVRMNVLDARYVKPPSIRPAEGSADWKPVEPYKLDPIQYAIAVDEFAEVEVRGAKVFNRAELRAICDKFRTKEKIIEALSRSSAARP